MTDPDATETTLDSFSDLPMQPTGSGVADLEIAYEQMKLEDAGNAAQRSTDVRATDEGTVGDGPVTSAALRDDAAESAAHPS